MQWSIIQSGILAEYFAPGYDRYFFSLRSPKAWPGWAAFDGKKMCSLREVGEADLSKYREIVEESGIFYAPQPAMPPLLGKIGTYAESFRIQMPIAIQSIKENLGIPSIVCRNATIHRNSWGAVLNAEVIIEELEDQTAVSVIRKHRHHIINSAVKYARAENLLNSAAYLPIGYANVAVFRRDYRSRRLYGFGLGSDLVCTVRLRRIARINLPDIMGSIIEDIGKWRIAWNKSWIETSGQKLD